MADDQSFLKRTDLSFLDSMTKKKGPVVLLILDGWGHSDQGESNAIARARTPVWNRLWSQCPRTLIRASGPSVGLPRGQMGNSEVGHLNIGADRVVYRELTLASRAIRTGSFFTNRTLTDAVDNASGRTAVHIMGLLSPGGVHSHERLMDGGALCDVAPTLLAMMGLDQPQEMLGQSLIRQQVAML